MARSAQLAMRGFGGRVRGWGDFLNGIKHRMFEGLGALLVMASLLLLLIDGIGFAPLALPLAMTAAALVALLLLSVIGLSPGEWRVIGSSAGRIARVSGHGTIAAAAFGHRVFRDWRTARRVLDSGPKPSSVQAVVSRKPASDAPGRPSADRREPRRTVLPTAI